MESVKRFMKIMAKELQDLNRHAKLTKVFVVLLVVVASVIIIKDEVWYQLNSVYYEDSYTYDEYYDSSPIDIITIDNAVDVFLINTEPNFKALYNNRGGLDSYNFKYLDISKELNHQDNYSQNVESVVYITAVDDTGIYFGSGSILTSDGLILTNDHVISGSDKVVVATNNGDLYNIEKVVAVDSVLDIAFLKINASELRPVAIGDSNKINIGETTLVIGHPEGFLNSLSEGIVSGFRDFGLEGGGNQIQVTNSISLGNSGGVLLNTFGEIIGVPTSSFEYEGNIVQVQNINFAVPINSALELLDI